MALSQRYILICLIGFLIFLSTFPSLDATRKKGPAHHKTPPPSDDDTSPGASSSSPSTSPGPSSSSPSDENTSPGASSSSPSTSPGPSSSTPSTSPGASSSSPGVFDVTKHGAVADGKTDSCKAFESAWAAACSCSGGPSTFLVPTGDFLVGPVAFSGPCKTTPKVEIRGTLKAPSDLSASHNLQAWLEFKDLSDLSITGSGTGVVDGQGESSWAHKGCQNSGGKCNNPPVSLKLTKVNCGSVSNLKLLNSKGFHMNLCFSNNIKINDLTITAPGDSPNTDGIHLSDSTHIDITSSNIGVGDDCISIGQGASDVSISSINCGPGHGISIGSLGKYPNERDVTGVHVKNCTFEGTDNGVRVKTWPGSDPSKACNFTFEDIVVKDVKTPIIIDQEYCPGNKCGSKGPSKVKISDVVFSKIRGTATTPSPVKLVCSSEVVCENVQLNDINIKHASESPISSTCTNVKGLSINAMVNPQPCKT